jgi:hypothetical protein
MSAFAQIDVVKFFEVCLLDCLLKTNCLVGKLSSLLHKTCNIFIEPHKDWLELADKSVITGKRLKSISYKSNNYEIGLNILVNRFYALKQHIVLDNLNLNMQVFKKKMKIEFKPNEL